MHTQCPDCETAFRVTAPTLQQGSGRVLCTKCGKEFNALERLTEDPPAETGAPGEARALIDTLNELTGPYEIRIEDTGVEWRVIEDESDEDDDDGEGEPDAWQPQAGAEADLEDTSSIRWYIDDVDEGDESDTAEVGILVESEESGVQDHDDELNIIGPVTGARTDRSEASLGHLQESLALPASGSGEVQRYDDNTPLPDDFLDESEPVPQRRAEDRIVPRSPEADEAQVDLALGEPDDWMDLLDEVGSPRQDGGGAPGRAVLEELAFASADDEQKDPHAQAETPYEDLADTDVRLLEDHDARLADPDFPSDIDTQFDLQAIEMGIDRPGSRDLRLPDDDQAGHDDGPGIAAKEPAGRDEEPVRASPELELVTDGQPGRGFAGADLSIASPHSDADIMAPAAGATEMPLSGENLAVPADATGEEAEERLRERAFERELDEAYSITLDDEPAPVDREPAESAHFVPAPTEEELTINMLIDQDLIRLAEQQDVFTSTNSRGRRDDPPHVETIIMEGESVRTALEAELVAESARDSAGERPHAAGDRAGAAAGSTSDDEDILLDTYAGDNAWMRGGRQRTDPPSYRIIGGVAALTLLLAAQVVHAYRDTLATYSVFERTIGSVYRLFGETLNPDWNIRDWQFESTNGSTDELDQVLTISSHVANSSGKALPYPLLHVSLTDRWEEIIGSKVLEPREYLADGTDPESRVPSGSGFTAIVRIESPSAEATGFKLNVCYPDTGNRMRCATEDFKD